MSAIFGIFRFDGGDVARRDLERAGNALAHRGPDGRKIIVEGAVGLGQCLMRVNREDFYEAQPLCDQHAMLTLVADLRLDNRDELASIFGIGAAQLACLPDSALLMQAYRTWGADCASHLLGDFAFAIWDKRARELVLGRDHMGQRHLHYHRGNGFFAFATDLKALWSFRDVPQILSEVRIGQLLFGDRSWSNGETSFDGIYGLTGATIMTIGADGSAKPRRYWEPRADPAHAGRDEDYYVNAYRQVLGEAVACRIRRTARPPGIVFSGGYDSAAIAGLAGLELAGLGRKLVAAASVMPADYRGTIRHARRWVESCARKMSFLDVHYVTREGRNVLSDLEQAFLESDGPVSPYHFVTTELMSTLARSGAQLIMDGHGGDYTLNPRGQTALARFLATFQVRRFFSELGGHLRLSGHSLWMTLKADLAAPLLPPAIIALWRRARRGFAPIWSDRPINPAFARRLIAQGVVDPNNSRSAALSSINVRERMASVLRRVASAHTSLAHAAAARHGLELTRPFHDKRVVELALAVPPDLDVRNGRNRYLACTALKDLLPQEFQTRWRRNDDEIPDFQRMVKSIEPELLADIGRMEQSEKLARYVDFEKVRALLAARGPDNHASGWEAETQSALFALFVGRYVEWHGRHNR